MSDDKRNLRDDFEKEMHEMAGVSEINREDSADPQTPQQFPKHHPAGLWVLFTTEMWERFCYYGMRALLTLYLVAAVSDVSFPGFGWSQKAAYNFYGSFTGLVYLMPLLCGWIADRFIGQHRSMLFGGTLIAIGEFCLAATELVRNGKPLAVTFQNDPVAFLTFFAGMALIVIGTGFFKPCISVMVGQLYGKNDPRRDGGFTIFYMGINLGAFLCPFVAGTLAEKFGWGWGFFSAGVGMVLGLITYSVFRPKYLSHIGLPPQKVRDAGAMTPLQFEEAKQKEYEMTRPLTRVDLDKVFVIVALTLFTIAFWLAFEQAGSSLNIFAKDSTDRRVPEVVASTVNSPYFAPFLKNEGDQYGAPANSGIATFPATWYQSANPLFIITLAPIFAWFWIFLDRKRLQPSTPVKFGIGLLLVSSSFLVMIPAAVEAKQTGGFTGPQWLIISYFLATCGELCLSPVGLSMVTKLAPVRYASMLMGFWFVSSAIANYLSGAVAAMFGTSEEGTVARTIWFGPDGGMADFFLLISIIPAVVGIIVLFSSKKLKAMMHGAG